MHDLNTISRVNAEAHGKGIAALQAKGLHVVANYDGLTLNNFKGHDTVESATAALTAPVDSPDQNRRLFPAQPGDRTLGDYVARISATA